MGEAYLQLNQFDLAKEAFLREIEGNGSHPVVVRALSYNFV